MSTEQLFFNGIDAVTGDYLLPPMTTEQVAKMAQGEKFDPAQRTTKSKVLTLAVSSMPKPASSRYLAVPPFSVCATAATRPHN